MRDSAGKRPGFTLVELLISLAIGACLLIAVAAAFNASVNATRFNDSYFRCTQAARVALDQITTELRRADAVRVDHSNTIVEAIRPMEERTANEIYRQYAFDAEGRRITLQIFYAGQAPSPIYELARDISACTFGPAETDSGTGGAGTVIRVPISITSSIGGSSVTLHGAASPRRAL